MIPVGCVTLLEARPTSEEQNTQSDQQMLVKNNHLSDKIIVVPGKIEDISLPEAVDVIISEPMGYMLFNERMLESYLHSKKWLKANGMMFPTFGDIHLAPFSDEQLYMEHYSRANFWYQQCFYGVNLSSLRGAAVDEYFRQPIVDTFDSRILMARTVKYTVNFMDAEEADLHRVEIPFVFQLTQSGLVHGLAFWFDVAFVGSLYPPKIFKSKWTLEEHLTPSKPETQPEPRTGDLGVGGTSRCSHLLV
ncbi:histone-arginine methyltransferase CARM1-like isoform X4 [Leptonychotes weddellii]|uniref:Histone-arginine methyltransferase CARM1-like isoform X4 n=1 Tax=Leptonychotes weddellii TaxID=9713 RepID=A0A7F8R3V4_LEPWE|nr:histone-arginine methyltransferase CARM1-like isoform X4 [Leptonychotes weddellii]